MATTAADRKNPHPPSNTGLRLSDLQSLWGTLSHHTWIPPYELRPAQNPPHIHTLWQSHCNQNQMCCSRGWRPPTVSPPPPPTQTPLTPHPIFWSPTSVPLGWHWAWTGRAGAAWPLSWSCADTKLESSKSDSSESCASLVALAHTRLPGRASLDQRIFGDCGRMHPLTSHLNACLAWEPNAQRFQPTLRDGSLDREAAAGLQWLPMQTA
jgi:hypothetical protein